MPRPCLTQWGCGSPSGHFLSSFLHWVRVGAGVALGPVFSPQGCQRPGLWSGQLPLAPAWAEGCWPCALGRGGLRSPASAPLDQCRLTSWQGSAQPREPEVLNITPPTAVCVFVIQVVGSFTLKHRLFKKNKKAKKKKKNTKNQEDQLNLNFREIHFLV